MTRVVVARLARRDTLAVLAQDVADDGELRGLTDARDALRAKLALADDDYAEDKISRDQHNRITPRLRSKLDAAEDALRTASGSGLDLTDLTGRTLPRCGRTFRWSAGGR